MHIDKKFLRKYSDLDTLNKKYHSGVTTQISTTALGGARIVFPYEFKSTDSYGVCVSPLYGNKHIIVINDYTTTYANIIVYNFDGTPVANQSMYVKYVVNGEIKWLFEKVESDS